MRRAIQDFKLHKNHIVHDNEINIRIAGTGGQGVIKAGLILSEAFVMRGKNVAQIQSYGPEARGGACRTDIVISDGEIDYPGLRRLDYFVVMHESAYRKYMHLIDDKTTVIYDSSLANVGRGIGIPFTELSKKEFGSAMFANMIAIGTLCAIMDITIPEVTSIIRKRMSKAEDNVKAFMLGLEVGKKKLVIAK